MLCQHFFFSLFVNVLAILKVKRGITNTIVGMHRPTCNPRVKNNVLKQVCNKHGNLIIKKGLKL